MDSIISDIAYHDYVAMLSFIDSEWTKTKHKNKKELIDSFLYGQKQLTQICFDYGYDIIEKYEKFYKANNQLNFKGGKNRSPKEELKSYLYHSINYVSFGTLDNLSIMLFDDFDPIHHITSETRTTSENYNLAFCPVMKSLHLDRVDFDAWNINVYGLKNTNIHKFIKVFSELHTLPDNNNWKISPKKEITTEVILKGHNFKKSTLLLVFTKFK